MISMTGPASAPNIAPIPLPRLPAPKVFKPPRFFERLFGPKRSFEGIWLVFMMTYALTSLGTSAKAIFM